MENLTSLLGLSRIVSRITEANVNFQDIMKFTTEKPNAENTQQIEISYKYDKIGIVEPHEKGWRAIPVKGVVGYAPDKQRAIEYLISQL